MKPLNGHGYIENPFAANKHCANIQQLTLLAGMDDDNGICRERVQSNTDQPRSVDRRTQCNATDQASGQGHRVEDSRMMCGERWLTTGSPFV
tara:strand:+ start:2493 stop:2768 length:276 start_codon:yes stop_codon:yes gene_type:complete